MGSVSNTFYLTGGTALGRFMLQHRYSDDLDFFGNAMQDFEKQTANVLQVFNNAFQSVQVPIREESFVRAVVSDQPDVSLKIELINDVSFRVGEVVTRNEGFRLDTWENILTNKLTALSRQAAKDFIDILFLCLKYPFSWEKMIESARQKDAWINEIAISKFLFDFDFKGLKDVKFPFDFEMRKIKPGLFEIMARESLHGFDNSLYGRTLQ